MIKSTRCLLQEEFMYSLQKQAGRQALSPDLTSAKGWLPKGDESVDFVEVSPTDKLGWGES